MTNQIQRMRANHLLVLASYHGYLSIAEESIGHGVNVNTTYGGIGWTPLHCAVKTNSIKVAKLLIEHGADIEYGADVCAKTIHGGCTPLMRAAEWGNLSTVDLLLKHKANINAIDNNGISILQCAVKHNTLKVVKSLLEWGADITHKAKDGTTALDIAIYRDKHEVAELLQNYVAY